MLSVEQKNNLVRLIDFEIKHFLCEDVPKYQSYNYMHIKHKDNEAMDTVLKNTASFAYALTEQKVSVKTCWFNVLKEDSDYGFHKHETLTAVYFLEGCADNGTLILEGSNELQLPCMDNTIQFLGANVMHSIPKWSGVDRYSIAIELMPKA